MKTSPLHTSPRRRLIPGSSPRHSSKNRVAATKRLIAILTTVALSGSAGAESTLRQFTVSTSNGAVLMEGFGTCAKPPCPAVMILSGSKGFASPGYQDLGKSFRAAGLDAYLIHVLSTEDLNAIGMAGSARSRIAYNEKRLPDWVSMTRQVTSTLKGQAVHGGKVGIVGISLGAQIASAASVRNTAIDALILVDGGFPNGLSWSGETLPPLHLIWGSKDMTFPLSIGRTLKRTAERFGGSATLDVYKDAPHDFFLRSGTSDARAAHESATDFLVSTLLSKP